MPKQKQETWSERLVQSRPQYFWWTLTIIVCVVLAITSWIYVPAIFNNPHFPQNYKILDKIGRLPEIKAFKALEPPEGDIRDVKTLYNQFRPFTEPKLLKHNNELIKNYIGNFKYEYINNYIQGDFRIIRTRKLTADDVFTSGIIVQASAVVKPDVNTKARAFPVWIEFILPNAPTSAADDIKPGTILEISKNPFFASIINVERIERTDDDPIMNFTIVPLVYEASWNLPNGGKFSILPPKKLNLDAKLPIF